MKVNAEKTPWVLFNFLSNAIRHSGANSRIEIRLRSENHSFQFSVTGQGKGIDRLYRDKVFGRYFQVPGNGKSGTGLGLTISKEFIAAQGGSIGVESELATGSRFYFFTHDIVSLYYQNTFKMAEDLMVPVTTDRRTLYETLFPQIEALVSTESDLTANLANISAALKEVFGFFWVGFYLVKEGQLVLGPFQGPVACTRIPFHKGVCGACYSRQKTMIVPDVDQFPGHIACSSASKSEIVLPVFHRNGTVAMVLDVDSDSLDDFSEIDAMGLERIVRLIERKL